MGNKRKPGDRKDAKLIRDVDGLHYVMGHLYRDRTDNEAFISISIDLGPMNEWVEKHKNDDPEFPYTFFHLIVAALLKTVILRPKMNRFYSNRNYYQRNDYSASFIVKRQFKDNAGEGMAFIKALPEFTVQDVHGLIRDQVMNSRNGDNSSSEDNIDTLTKMPRFLGRIVMSFLLFLDRHGWMPDSEYDSNSNYSSVFITNLGSIKLNCGYHHLSNFGSSSVFVIIGEKKFVPVFAKDGSYEMKETLDIGLTLDERIADGYYYSRTVKLLQYLLQHPELLEKPLGEEVDYDE